MMSKKEKQHKISAITLIKYTKYLIYNSDKFTDINNPPFLLLIEGFTVFPVDDSENREVFFYTNLLNPWVVYGCWMKKYCSTFFCFRTFCAIFLPRINVIL